MCLNLAQAPFSPTSKPASHRASERESASARSEPEAPERPRPAATAERYRTVVTPASPDASLQTALDRRTPGFATAIAVEDASARRPLDAVGQALVRTPGATVRSTGGLGQFSAVSLRGSSAEQVGLFIDGVPLGGTLAGLLDLSNVGLQGLERIEVYRGYVPIAFGGATIGGAIDFVSRHDTGPASVEVGAGVGSFGARESTVSLSTPLARGLRLTTRVGYGGATGNFAFANNGGTPLYRGDDTVATRANNDYERVLVQTRIDGRRGRTRFGVGQWLGYKHQGIAGTANAPADAARFGTLASRTIGSVKRDQLFGAGGHVAAVFGVGILRQHFVDPRGEIGAGLDDQRSIAIDLYASPRLRIGLWSSAFLRVITDARYERIAVDERAPTPGVTGDAVRHRVWVGAGLELEQFLIEDRWLLVPAVRVDALDARFAAASGAGEIDDAGIDAQMVGASPRLGTRVRLPADFQIRASAGRYFRPPALLELFGDRGYFVGNEGLVPERGTAVDGGIVFDRRTAALATYATVAGFGTFSKDLIQWVSAGPVARAENIEGARVAGLEAALEFTPESKRFTFAGNYTFVESEDRSADPTRRGNALPGRPRHALTLQPGVGYPFVAQGIGFVPRILYTLEFVAGTNLDPSGRLVLPPRALQSLGAELHAADRLHVGIEVRNLLDVRTANVTLPVGQRPPVSLPVSDFIGYPLPGRSLWASVRIEFQFERHRRRQ